MKEEDIELDVSAPDRPAVRAKFIQTYNPPQQALQHFASITWTNAWLQNPSYHIVPCWSRHKKSSGEDFFFSKTINSEKTVPHMVPLTLRDLSTPDVTSPTANANTAQANSSYDYTAITSTPAELVVLVQLGALGVDGFPNVIHGGVTCALLDEIMSMLVAQHRINLPGGVLDGSLFTVNLNTNFRAPVQTPGPVVVKCWLVRRHKRKWLTRGQIEDEYGRILADADAVWVVTRSEKI